jgi:hypothetical protein
MQLDALPEWLATALLAAALAMLGFVGKQVLEWIASLSAARRKRRARLVTLLSLLRGSEAVFRVQARLRNQLFELLSERLPVLAELDAGYEEVFSTAFATMTRDERELHAVIRGYTVHGLKPLNEAMRLWLEIDTEFKLARLRRRKDGQLARQLVMLEQHLLMWLAKYATWIPETPSHALVYLGDEEGHGVPFPTGIQSTIEDALGIAAGRG